MNLSPYYADDSVTLYHGDNRDVLAALPDESLDACVTDPPYELAFMGRRWDATGIAYDVDLWRQVMRVLKPGGHLLAFGGTRTWHRLAVAIEDAGFEVRDSICWLYGSGFPKSLDVSKAIDKAAGVEREVRKYRKSETAVAANMQANGQCPDCMKWKYSPDPCRCPRDNGPQTPDAAKWQGWGTALKPAFEPVVVARKPLIGTVAENVLTHGTGALNVDGCRIKSGDEIKPMSGKSILGGSTDGWDRPWKSDPDALAARQERANEAIEKANQLGRWPANVILDESQAAELDRQSGVLHSQDPATRASKSKRTGVTEMGTGASIEYGDTGGASRFFYTPKASSDERPRVDGIAHPTVKPLDLMRYLVRLVTPPGGTVLEPFAGSGTTAEACVVEGFRCIAIERETDYLPLITARLSKPIEMTLL